MTAHEPAEVRAYRRLIQQGFAYGPREDLDPAEAQAWIRQEMQQGALLGRGLANQIIEDEAEALRRLGLDPWTGGPWPRPSSDPSDNLPQGQMEDAPDAQDPTPPLPALDPPLADPQAGLGFTVESRPRPTGARDPDRGAGGRARRRPRR